MKNTSCGENCPFVKIGCCKTEKECPNYMESWWVEGKSQEPILLTDCVPKRMLLQQQLLQTRFEGVQQALEQQRNENIILNTQIKSLVEISKTLMESQFMQLHDDYGIGEIPLKKLH